MKKYAYAATMTYEVNDAEKDKAEKAIRRFKFVIKLIDKCEEHLDLFYLPIKKNPSITPDELFKVRAILRRYRDKVVENFTTFKEEAFNCYMALQPFSSDSQIDKLIKSFVGSIEDIEQTVNEFIELFDQIKSDEFLSGSVSEIEKIKTEIGQLEEIVKERIIPHVQSNILAQTWVDVLSTKIQEKVEKEAPKTVELSKQRMEMQKNQ